MVRRSTNSKNTTPRQSRAERSGKWGRLLKLFILISLLICLGALVFKFFTANAKPVAYTQVLILLDSQGRSREVGLLIEGDLETQNRLVLLSEPNFLVSLPDKSLLPLSQAHERLVALNTTPHLMTAWYSWQFGRLVDEVMVLPTQSQQISNSLFGAVFRLALEKIRVAQPGEAGELLALAQSLRQARVEQAQPQDGLELRQSGYNQPAALAGSQCSVAVVNATNKSGLAADTSQLIEQNGGYVARTVNSEIELATSVVLIDQGAGEGCYALASRLQQFLPADGEVQVHSEVTTRYRSDIAIMLGEDIGQLMTVRSDQN